MRLANQIAIVTGSGSGIGRATALLFAKEGARVIVADIDEDAGRRTVSEIELNGGEALYVGVDVGQAASVEAMIQQVVERFGRVDILVNNAGIQRMGTVEETTDEDWQAVLGVNLTGVFLCSRAVIPQMKKLGAGNIINIASGAGMVGVPQSAAYCASKGGVVLLTRQMALDYERFNLRVNAICPGAVNTPLMEGFFRYRRPEDPEAYRQEYEAALPLGRMLCPDEVAFEALVLASHKSYLLTGHCVMI